MASVFFKRGEKARLASAPLQEGAIYVTVDERAMYIDTTVSGTLKRIRLGDFREYTSFSQISALSPTDLDKTALYYASTENILCKWTGSQWKQINAQPALDELVYDIFNSVTAVTGGVNLKSAFRNPDDYTELISGNVKFVSGNTSKIAISGTDNNDGLPVITITPDAIVYGLGVAVSNGTNVTNLTFTLNKTGTDASGNTVNTSSPVTLPIEGIGVDVYESSGKLVISNAGGIEALTASFDNSGQFFVQAELSDGNYATSTAITPTIRYGQTSVDAVFANGVAVLDVYTKSEVDTAIQTRLRAANAMTFKGAVGTTQGAAGTTLPTTDVNVGDTYKVSSDGTYGGRTAKVGDMFIATGTEDSSTGYITGTINWVYIPSGDDDTGASTYTLEYNGSTGYIELVDELGMANGELVAGTDIAFSSNGTSPVISHGTVTRQNTNGQAKTQQSGQGALVFNVVTGVTTSATGHVTGVETTQVTIADEYNAIKDVSASAAMSNNDAEITIQVEDELDIYSGSFKLHSNSLNFSASGDTTTIDMQWGSF